VSAPVVLAVDGGNSKTDLALVSADGEVLSLVRGPLSSPHHLGLDGSLQVLRDLLDQASAGVGLDASNGPVADFAQLLMAGIDFPSEEEELREAVEARGWARQTRVANDTFAVLRAGTERGWGVAVVCGSGINCVGVAPDGRQARFPALGAITGDWGGGHDVGLAGLSAAARSEDGRGPKTSLEQSVPAHFGLTTPQEVAEAMHLGTLARRRVLELAPLVFASAASDEVAAGIVHRLVDEIAALVRASLTRLDLTREHVEVALGGGVARNLAEHHLELLRESMREVGPRIELRPTSAPPVLGAALCALGELGVDGEAQIRVRAELAKAGGNDG